MIVTSHTENVLGCKSGRFGIWSLSDGYLDMPATLLRDEKNRPVPMAAGAGALRLSVNCFALAGPGADGILIDCGGGGWAPTVGRLEQSLAEAGIDPASITILALTHSHQDHILGLLARDGRALLPNLGAIFIPEAAVARFLAEPGLARFRPLLRPLRDSDHVAERLRMVSLPGHAAGHSGYLLDTHEDRFLFVGDIVHVPALQFADPALTWGYDDDQPAARATRLNVFNEVAGSGMWIAGAHLGRPGIGRVTRKDGKFCYEPGKG